MGNRVIQMGSAAEMGEKSAESGNDGPGSPGQNSEASLLDSDVSGSVSSNVVQGSTMPEWGSVPGLQEVKGRRRILIVDDESAIADTLQMIFQMQRYDARVAYSAERAAE